MPALVKAQGAIGTIPKNKTARVRMKAGGEYTFRYADISDVLVAIRPHMLASELVVMQDCESVPSGIQITTRITHSSGEFVESSPLVLAASVNDPQGVGSACTYARRQSLASLLGLAVEEDDDGNKAKASAEKTDKRKAMENRLGDQTGEAATDEQLLTIAKLMTSTKADRAKFLETFHVSDFPELTLDQASQAIVMLKRKAVQTPAAGA